REAELRRIPARLDDQELLERVTQCAVVLGNDRRDRGLLRNPRGTVPVHERGIGLDVDLETPEPPPEAQPDAGRDLLLGPTLTGADEPRQARIVFNGPRTLREEAPELSAGPIDEGDRHPTEGRPRHTLHSGSRQAGLRDAKARGVA